MDNENSFSLNLKRCLACKRRCNTIDEFIAHIKEPNHDDLVISTYSKYVDGAKKRIKFLEFKKNIITGATLYKNTIMGEIMEKYMAQIIIYNILTTNHMDVMNELGQQLFVIKINKAHYIL